MKSLIKIGLTVFVLAGFTLGLAACSPEVGSKEWCQQMKEKGKADWTVNEAKDFTKHCLL